jgi:uroporphyrinogen decarboxylase
MKVLVTGGSGRVGGYVLRDLLRHGHAVSNFGRTPPLVNDIPHSAGRLWQVLDDLISLGVNALHPIEAKAMDIYDLKRRYGQKLAIFGNVDLGYTLEDGQGTPEAVRAEVRKQIKELAPGGGYGLASGAGLTRYVKLENFLAMRETLYEYGTYPIGV